jgi:hypothetical protein
MSAGGTKGEAREVHEEIRGAAVDGHGKRNRGLGGVKNWGGPEGGAGVGGGGLAQARPMPQVVLGHVGSGFVGPVNVPKLYFARPL